MRLEDEMSSSLIGYEMVIRVVIIGVWSRVLYLGSRL